MPIHWLTLVVAVLAGPAAVADDPPKPLARPAPEQEQTLEARIAALRQNAKDRDKKFLEDLRAAKGDRKQVQEANERNRTETREAADKLRALIREGGADSAAFEGVLVLVKELRYFLDDELTQQVL